MPVDVTVGGLVVVLAFVVVLVVVVLVVVVPVVVVLTVVVGAEVVIPVLVVVAGLLPPFAKVAMSGKPTTVPIKHKTKVIIRSALSLFRLLHLVNSISSLIFSRHRE